MPSTRGLSHHAPSGGRCRRRKSVRGPSGSSRHAPGKLVKIQAFGPEPNPEIGERNLCKGLRSRGIRDIHRMDGSRTINSASPPASCTRAAASRADCPAPTIATRFRR
jgi:hypothetical protein